MILGIDFLNDLGIKIDYQRNEVTDSKNNEIPILKDYDHNQSCSTIGHVLTSEQTDNLQMVINKIKPKFEQAKGRTSILKHKIKLKPNTEPIKQRYYPVSPIVQQQINKYVDTMLEDGIISPSSSPWSSPIFLIPKKDKTYRFVYDARKVNSVSEKDSYPTPYVKDILSKLAGCKYFSRLDLLAAYFQIELDEQSRPITAFCIPNKGLFEFNVMPFGLHAASATFQRLIDKVLNPVLQNNVFVYQDDIIIATPTFEKHLEILEQVANLLVEAGLKVNMEKSTFLQTELCYLGYIVRDGGIEVDKEKVSCILEYPQPKDVKQMRRFLGLTGWFSHFIQNYSKIIEPLTSLLRKKVPFKWTDVQQNAFTTLKSKMVSAPILICPNYNFPFVLHCDASNVAIGGCLTQNLGDGDRAIAYYSRTLSSSERNLSTTERETLAVIACLEKFRQYIEGIHVTVITDHYSLLWLLRMKNPQNRLARWLARLQQFDFHIEHRKGKDNVVPDALSRLSACKLDVPEISKISFTHTTDQEHITLCNKVRDNPDAHKKFNYTNEKLYKQLVNRDGETIWRVCVPKDKIQEVISKFHCDSTAAHFGSRKTLDRIHLHYTWHGQSRDIRKFTQSCKICQQHKSTNKSPPGLMKPKTMVPPWKIITSDILGPYPSSNKRNKFLVVFVDTSTKYVIAVPMRSATATTVSNALYRAVLLRFGCPEILLSDNGVQYISTIFKNVCQKFGIIQKFTPLYHPQANPTERYNRTIKTSLTMYCRENQKLWDQHIEEVLYAINTCKNDTTGFSPAYLNYGRELKTPHDIHNDLEITTYILDHKNLADSLHKNLQLSFQKASETLKHNSEQQAKYYNLRRRDDEYFVGQLVWRKNKTLSSKVDNIAQSLLPKFIGPCEIQEKLGNNTYKLKTLTGKGAGTWHIQDLKKVV